MEVNQKFTEYAQNKTPHYEEKKYQPKLDVRYGSPRVNGVITPFVVLCDGVYNPVMIACDAPGQVSNKRWSVPRRDTDELVRIVEGFASESMLKEGHYMNNDPIPVYVMDKELWGNAAKKLKEKYQNT